MGGRNFFAQATLAWVAVTALGCVQLDKDYRPDAYAGGQVRARGASDFAASASQRVRSGSQAITSKLKNLLPKSKSRWASGERVANNDPTSLEHDPGPLGADLYIAAARLSEMNGRLDQAMQQYQRALNADSHNRNAMIGLARLQHRKGEMQASIRTYREALNIHRNDPVILNDLGLCYARDGQLDQAINVLRTATRVAPDREMYRNNLAAALVEANRAGEAVAHLTQTYGPAIANYNVGYLLNRSDRVGEAAQFLTRALEIDPTMQQARTMLNRARPQVSSLPKARSSASRQYITDTAPQSVYRPLPTSTPDLARPPATPTSRPPQLPERLNNIPQRYGPFGFLPLKQNAKTSLVSYEEEETSGKEPVPVLSATAAAVVSLRRPVNQIARGGKIEPPEPTE